LPDKKPIDELIKMSEHLQDENDYLRGQIQYLEDEIFVLKEKDNRKEVYQDINVEKYIFCCLFTWYYQNHGRYK